MDIREKIISLCKKTSFNEPMKSHTTFKIGGNADIFCEPQSTQELSELIKYLNSEDKEYIVIGNGSNLLVSDDGIRGVVIKIGDKMSEVSILGDTVKAQSGILLSRLSKLVAKEGLSGMELISGIPGSLGGAVYMNAGAYGAEIGDVIKEVRCVLKNGEIKTFGKEELLLGYRKSVLMENGAIVTECVLKLKKGNKEEINALMGETTKKRVEKQPLELPSAGSTFKRPEGYFAGKLIEDSGLKGYRSGGAMISQKHAGFVVNIDNATAKDVMAVITHAQTVVLEKYGVMLEPEIRFIG